MSSLSASLPSNRRLVLYLVFLAGLLPEAITGSTPPLAWLNQLQALLNLWLYGTGVLVVRELSLRWRTGWPGILLLGAAYGIIEEGLALATFYDPTLPQVASGSLSWYGRLFGVNWVWAVWLTIFHATVSMAFPIFIVEWHYPALRGRPLLSRRGLRVTAFLLALATVTLFALVSAFSAYDVGGLEYLGGIVIVALLFLAARRGVGFLWLHLPTGRMPKRWLFAASGYAFLALSFLVYAGGPALGGHPVVTYVEGGVLVLIALLLIRRTVGQPDGGRAQLAFIGGSIAFFSTFDLILGLGGDPRFLGMPIVGAVFLAYVVWLYRAKGPYRPPIPSALPSA